MFEKIALLKFLLAIWLAGLTLTITQTHIFHVSQQKSQDL